MAQATAHVLRLLTLTLLTAVFLVFALVIAPAMTLLACALGLLLLALGRRWNVEIREAGEALTRVVRKWSPLLWHGRNTPG